MQTGHPLVSIIVPNYNYARFLSERMKSINNQTFTDYEVIILDDASTDGSQELIETYRSLPYVSRIEINKINSGSPFKQWFKGIEMAKGELIWLAESDDTSDPRFLETLVNKMKDPDLVLAFTRSVLIDDDGVEHGIIQKRRTKDCKWKGKKIIRQKMCYTNSLIYNASSVLFRKDIALKVIKDFKNPVGSVGDWLFWIMMAEQGSIALVAEPLNLYRWHGKNTTKINTDNGINFKGSRQIFEYLKSKHLISYFNAINVKRRFTYNILYNTPYFTEETRNEVMKAWHINSLYVAFATVSHSIRKRKKKFLS